MRAQSHGYLICMVEHGDGTSPYTQKGPEEPGLYFEEVTEAQRLDFYFQYGLRTKHMAHRAVEITAVLQLIHECCNPEDGSPVPKEHELPLMGRVREILHNHAAYDRVFMAGHSFGAMTALTVTASEYAMDPFTKDDVVNPNEGGIQKDPEAVCAATIQRMKQKSTAAPRAPIRGLVAFEPWLFCAKPRIQLRGLAGAPVLLVASKQFSDTTNEDPIYNRAGMQEMLAILAQDRQLAGRKFYSAGAHDPRVTESIKKYGFEVGVDIHAQPMVPPIVDGTVANELSVT